MVKRTRMSDEEVRARLIYTPRGVSLVPGQALKLAELAVLVQAYADLLMDEENQAGGLVEEVRAPHEIRAQAIGPAFVRNVFGRGAADPVNSDNAAARRALLRAHEHAVGLGEALQELRSLNSRSEAYYLRRET